MRHRLAGKMRHRFVNGSVGVGLCNLMLILLFDIKQNPPTSTKAINKRFNRSGVLFQGRFQSIHVTETDYLIHLSLYSSQSSQGKTGSTTGRMGVF
jgi:hypothetical protein